MNLPPELSRVFFAMLSERVRAMRTALGASDKVSLRQLVHQVAGTGASFGFEILTDEGRRLEADIVHGVATTGAIADFIALCETVIASSSFTQQSA